MLPTAEVEKEKEPPEALTTEMFHKQDQYEVKKDSMDEEVDVPKPNYQEPQAIIASDWFKRVQL